MFKTEKKHFLVHVYMIFSFLASRILKFGHLFLKHPMCVYIIYKTEKFILRSLSCLLLRGVSKTESISRSLKFFLDSI